MKASKNSDLNFLLGTCTFPQLKDSYEIVAK